MRLSDYSQSGGRGLFRRDRRVYLHRGTHTFTIPDGVTKVWAFSIGAGGGGANYGDNSGNFSGGRLGGGKGGGYASGIISGLTPGGTLTLTVGAGGVGGFETTAATAGANSTVVGGGTTYLQGSGGGAASSTKITSDPGTGKGQGGAASTSGVTDAYTAAGGGSYNWPAGIGNGSYTTSTMNLIMGGGASGTPWGTGMPGVKAVGNMGTATGGGGWAQIDYPRTGWLGGTSGEYGSNGRPYGGAGSHYQPKPFCGQSMKFQYAGINGGDGRTAIGGLTMNMSHFSSTDDYVYDNKTLAVFDTLGMYPQHIENIHKVKDGQDSNPNWWFPWEIDGAGGGGVYANNQAGMVWYGGKGGSGSGGGSATASCYNSNGSIQGGAGGFGGGGGGCQHTTNTVNNLAMAWGGHGGNGGGGGSAWGRADDPRYMAIGGEGGDGAIGIYW